MAKCIDISDTVFVGEGSSLQQDFQIQPDEYVFAFLMSAFKG